MSNEPDQLDPRRTMDNTPMPAPYDPAKTAALLQPGARVWQFQELALQLTAADDEVTRLRDKLAAANASIADLRADVGSLRDKLGERNEEVESLKEQLASRESECKRLTEVYHWAQALLTALNTGDVQKESLIHKKLRQVLIEYRAALSPSAAPFSSDPHSHGMVPVAPVEGVPGVAAWAPAEVAELRRDRERLEELFDLAPVVIWRGTSNLGVPIVEINEADADGESTLGEEPLGEGASLRAAIDAARDGNGRE